MANLAVTFTSAYPSPVRALHVPLAVGSAARSELVDIGSQSTGAGVGGLSAAADETAVELTADIDCWVSVGPAPAPDDETDGTRSAHFLKAGIPYAFWVSEGDKVAAIEA